MSVSYRPTGNGQQMRRASFDLSLIPEPRLWLEERLGVLAQFEVVESVAAPAEPSNASTVRRVRCCRRRARSSVRSGSARERPRQRHVPGRGRRRERARCIDAPPTLCPNQERWAAVAQRMMARDNAVEACPGSAFVQRSMRRCRLCQARWTAIRGRPMVQARPSRAAVVSRPERDG